MGFCTESETKDFLSVEQGIFYIGRNSLPKRTQLDLDTVKLLEQVSLIDFKEENIKILEEAIRYADSLLTKEAFHGTTNNHCWSPDSIEPMISLCDEINPDLVNCFVDGYDTRSLNDCSLASDIMRYVPDTWEGYIVAPLGNVPAEQK
ncbi:Glutamyl-tRNA(Gln) amidotransferase subunit C mitochondrial [Schistosoma japonicum]|nr:Glutamyl-tRNA(Gln) amidotransferase subunit C mitochondrial [Schistosoma japonicum]